MANNLGSLVVSLGLDAAQFTRGLSKGEYESQQSVSRMKRDFDGLVKYVAGLGIGAALVQSVRSTADASKEIDRLAKLSATSAENFQAQAYAAQQAGISQEKLADIFKDTQDKVGDFLQNGAGPLKDFFDNIAPRVGVTADEFRRLSGPEALQLYVSSLEKANLSQSELTFYMEAIASDSALLLPLLRDNGSEMARFADEAGRVGKVLDDQTIAANKRFADQLQQLEARVQSAQFALGSTLIPELLNIIKLFDQAGNSASGFFGKVFLSPQQMEAKNLSEGVFGRNWADELKDAKTALAELEKFRDGAAKSLAGSIADSDPRLEAARRRVARAQSGLDSAQRAALYGDGYGVGLPPMPRPSTGTGAVPPAPSRSRSASGRSTGKDDYQRMLDEFAKAEDDNRMRVIRQRAKDEEEATRALVQFRRQTDIDELANIERKNAAYQDWMKSLTDATPTARLEEQRQTMAALAEEYERGRFGAAGSAEAIQLYGEVVNTYLGNLNQGVQRINATADAAGSIFGSWLERAITDGAKLSDVINGLIQDLVRLAIQKSVIEPASNGVSTFIGGLLGGGGSKVDSFNLWETFLNYDGGGYTGMGARSGGLDGKGGFMAMLHPNETVIDHTRGQSLGGGVTVVQTFNIGSNADERAVLMLRAEARRIKEETIAAVSERANRGGAFARSIGRL